MNPFFLVSAGQYHIGILHTEADSCVRHWKNRLISPNYNESVFRDWILKEYPRHKVESHAFEMAQKLVSNRDVQSYLSKVSPKVPESFTAGDPSDHPVWGVSREWAGDYCNWLSTLDKHYNYRLPTETEWEIASRGTDLREYPYGFTFNPDAANTIESGIGSTTSVDRYRDFPGPFGHLDLAGNVEEWVSTDYYVYPGGIATIDDLYERLGPAYPILRGGSFCCGGDLSRSTRRHGPFPDDKFKYTGFRLVREPKTNTGGSHGQRCSKINSGTHLKKMGALTSKKGEKNETSD